MRIVIGLLVGSVLLLVGAWYFFEEVLLVWVSILFNFFKGITLKSVLAWLAYKMRRLFFLEIPKKIIMFMVVLGMPKAWRLWVKTFSKKLLSYVDSTRERVKTYVSGLLGKHIAVIIGVAASVLVFVIGMVYFGVYVVYFVGGAPVLKFLSLFLSPLFKVVENLLFKTVMFLHINKAAAYVIQVLPDSSRGQIRLFWYRRKRTAILLRMKTRKGVSRRLQRLRVTIKQRKQKTKKPSVVTQSVDET